MTKSEFMNKFSRTFHRAGLKVKKHSPEILLGVGIVSGVAATVFACKATTKLSTVLENSKNNIDQIKTYVAENGYSEEYSEQDYKKDLTIVYTKSAVDLIKLYGPSVLLGAASIGCILSSHNIVRKRNVALAAAYASVDSSFKDYRKNVIDRFGKELDKELKFNIKSEEKEETVTNEDGTETVVKKTVTTATVDGVSDYARFFAEGQAGWEKDSEHNLYFLKCQERIANEMLQERGHVFLNEVYDLIDVPRTQAGQIMGWVYDPENPDSDNYIDFGIYKLDNERKRAFVNGHECNILLDFNVEGNVWNLMRIRDGL